MNRTALILFIILTWSCVYGREEPDSIFFEINDLSAYKTIDAGFTFSKTDPAYNFDVSGLNSYTLYEINSKNSTNFNGLFSLNLSDHFRAGGELKTDFSSNSSSGGRTQNKLTLMPLVGFGLSNFNLEVSGGYIRNNEKNINLDGSGVEINTDYQFSDKNNQLSIRADADADGLYDDPNYSGNSNISYSRKLPENSGKFLIKGFQYVNQYHIPFSDSTFLRIKRQEYDISTTFLYVISKNIRNISEAGIYQRDKDSFTGPDFLNYNSNSSLKISDEMIYKDRYIFSSLRSGFETGSEKYSLALGSSDRSFAFYSFSLASSNRFNLKNYYAGINASYLKHEYKSLTDYDTDDRDIIKISVDPVLGLSIKSFRLEQSFPLEYYHLINISSEKSSGNYTDRSVNSVTDLRTDINDKLYLTGKIHLKSYYRSYDFDKSYSSSFIIKNFSFSDTVAFMISERSNLKLSTKYIYEEFGNFNFDEFTENPLNFKDHYYISLSHSLKIFNSLKIKNEYYFHEIDQYDFDQNDFNEHILKRVYISHGPRAVLEYQYKRFHVYSSLDINNYRNNSPVTTFRIESSYSFK